MCGSQVRSSSSTTTPLRTSSPAARARPTRGWTPQARTTRSASSAYPSAISTERTAPPTQRTSRTRRSVWTSTPRSVRCRRTSFEAAGSSCRSISRSDCWASTTCAPRSASARAAETPRSPPPMTTARTPGRTALDRPRQSSIVRKACTPSGSTWSGVNRPRSGGSTGLEPVASTSVSYAIREPSARCTARASRSIPVTWPRVSPAGAGRAITSGL